MKAHDIETENLEAHVSICQERYQQLANRFDSLESRIERVETVVLDIHSDIEDLKTAQNSRWDKARDVIIGVLFSTTAFLLAQAFLLV